MVVVVVEKQAHTLSIVITKELIFCLAHHVRNRGGAGGEAEGRG